MHRLLSSFLVFVGAACLHANALEGQGKRPNTRCNAAFFREILPHGSTLETIHPVAEGGTYGEGLSDIAYPIQPTNLPALCAVIVNVSSSHTSYYRFGMFLPDQWNERFLAVGNGGFAGGMNWLDMGPGAHYGFATVSTDTGHNSSVEDLSWALGAPEKQLDWGWRSVHGMVQLGKHLTAAYYEKSIRYSYYSGCSTAGRQGLKEVQISPESFDGALIGSAAWDTNHLNNYATQVGIYDLPVTSPGFINYTKFPIIADEVVRQCDGDDGVVDGIVSAPQLCKLDFSELQCGVSSRLSDADCFSAAQIRTMKKVYSNWYSDSGEFLYTGFTFSSEDQWYTVLGGTEPTPFGVGYQAYFLYDDAAFQWQDFNDSSVAYAVKTDPGQSTASQYDISAYRRRGGKVIMYHGLADGLVPTKGSELYHERSVEAMGDIDDFFRLFLVPGMQHCWGTVVNAPWCFAGGSQAAALGNDTWSVPGFKDARHDALLALMEWTEHGEAPEQIIATTWKSSEDPSTGVLQQRPLCPYPKMAIWDRRGDVKDASSWSCGTDSCNY